MAQDQQPEIPPEVRRRLPPELRDMPGLRMVNGIVITPPTSAPTAANRAALVRALAMILVKAAVVQAPERGGEGREGE